MRFYVCVSNLDTGERRECSVTAATPEAALTTVLRRKWVAVWLLSEHVFRFVVSHESTLT